VIRTDDETTRDGLREHLASAGIASGIHYALPVHKQEAYAGWVRTGSLRHTEMIASTILSLPMYPELSDPDQQRVIEAINSFFAQRP
jgi:dTDP-4-amino-4,6-dideoxygalactose transaminase